MFYYGGAFRYQTALALDVMKGRRDDDMTVTLGIWVGFVGFGLYRCSISGRVGARALGNGARLGGFFGLLWLVTILPYR